MSIRPADAPGVPTTSNLNFSAGDIIPNSVTVQVPTAGADAGEIEISYDAFGNAGPTTEILVDLVGYTKNAGLASLQAQVDALQAVVNAATAPGAVGQEQIATDGVGASEIAPGAVGTSELAPGAINNTHIVNNSLTVDNLGPNSVGTSELIDGTVGLSEMNAVFRENLPVVSDELVAPGACSTTPIVIVVAGAPVGTRALVLVSRLLQGFGDNPGWIVTGGPISTVIGDVNFSVCNDGASVVAENPPDLLVSFIALLALEIRCAGRAQKLAQHEARSEDEHAGDGVVPSGDHQRRLRERSRCCRDISTRPDPAGCRTQRHTRRPCSSTSRCRTRSSTGCGSRSRVQVQDRAGVRRPVVETQRRRARQRGSSGDLGNAGRAGRTENLRMRGA